MGIEPPTSCVGVRNAHHQPGVSGEGSVSIDGVAREGCFKWPSSRVKFCITRFWLMLYSGAMRSLSEGCPSSGLPMW